MMDNIKIILYFAIPSLLSRPSSALLFPCPSSAFSSPRKSVGFPALKSRFYGSSSRFNGKSYLEDIDDEKEASDAVAGFFCARHIRGVATSLSASLLVLGTVFPAHAIDGSIYTGDYADPLHPFCERHIAVSPDRMTFRYSGTAVGPKNDVVLRGCSEEEQRIYGSRKGAFDGTILDGGRRITAGDGVHEGRWEPAWSKLGKQKYGDVDGIRWDDGNKWVRLDNPQDVLSFPNTYEPETSLVDAGIKWIFCAYVAFSLLAGAKEFSKRFQKWSDSK